MTRCVNSINSALLRAGVRAGTRMTSSGWRGFRVILLAAFVLSMLRAGQVAPPAAAQTAPPTFSVPYVGGDYVDPGVSPDANSTCQQNWTWLTDQCYNNGQPYNPYNPSDTSGNSSVPGYSRDRLIKQLTYLQAQHLGNFQRVWVSMDQLGSFDATTNQFQFVPKALANLDDALSLFQARRLSVDLVLLSIAPNDPSSNNCGLQDSNTHEFNPYILTDPTAGSTPRVMKDSYLQGVTALMQRIAQDNSAGSAFPVVKVVDLENEAFLQLEKYFCTGTRDITNLKSYYGANKSPGGPGCVYSDSGYIDTACVDDNVILPWLKALRQAALSGYASMNYTVSDTGRLITDTTGTWLARYQAVADVYDIHAYDSHPWDPASSSHPFGYNAWATAATLGKPWFVGEAGCNNSVYYPDSQNFCTYNNSPNDPLDCNSPPSGVSCAPGDTNVYSRKKVDSWWDINLRNDGAQAVMLEETNQAWRSDGANSSFTATPSGTQQSMLGQSVFAQGFDGQGAANVAYNPNPSTGPVGPGAHQFSSATVTGDAILATVAKADQTYSMYDLQVNPGTAHTAFVSKQGVSGTDNNGARYGAVKTVTFAVQLDAPLNLGGGSMVLASMAGPPSTAGTTSLLVGAGGALSLQYTDTNGSTKTLASTFMLNDSKPHTISIDRAYTNDSSGRAVTMLTFSLDGAQGPTSSASGILPLWSSVSLGAVSFTGTTNAPGAFHLDDVYLTADFARNPTGVRPDGLLQQMHGATTPHLGHTRGWLHARPVPAAIAPSPVSLNVTPLKLSISHEGIYRITYRWLQSNNINLDNVDVATLGLSDGGVPVPVSVSSTRPLFQSGDYLEFYGHPVNNTYNASNVYVLSDTVTAPLHAAQTPVVPPLHPVSSAITLYSDLKRALYLQTAPGAPYTTSTAWPSDGDGHWTEGHATVTPTRSAPTTLSFPLVHAVTTTGGSCFLTAPVYGQASQGADGSYTLQASITINGNPLPADPSFSWTDPSAYPTAHTLQATFPCSWLIDSSPAGTQNTLTVSVALQPGSPYDSVWVQSYHVGYVQNLCAVSSLSSSGPAASVAVPTPTYLVGILDSNTASQIKSIITNPPVSGSDGYLVQGFSQAPVSLWRVTNGVPSKLIGWQATPSTGTGGPCNTSPSTYDLAFADVGSTASEYVATAAPADPDSVAPLDLSTIANGGSTSATYLIISPSDFIPTLTNTQLPAPGGTSSFVAYRSRQMSTKVVDVNSIYDQYSNGQVNPEAIRTYITAAHASLGTTFVLLVGGDTYDYQNYYNCPADTYTDAQGVSHPFCSSNLNNRSFIPSLYTGSMQELDTPSDNLLAVPVGAASDAPQVAIGRMPVYTTAELQTVLTKSMNWSSGLSGYGGTASFVAHNRDGDAFRASSEQLIADLAPSFNRATIGRDYLTGDPTTDAGLRTSLLSAINSGQELVNWTGHASSYNWGSMVSLPDVAALTNVNKPAAVFEWGCQTAYYVYPLYRDISSTFLVDSNASGPTGAAITVGSTGQDLIDQQAVLSGGSAETGPTGVRYFYGYLSQGKSIGEALQLAKDDLLLKHPANSYANPDYLDVVNSYEVFGDPSLTLP